MTSPSPEARPVLPAIPLDQLGFDFDGVIADTAEAFIRIACEEYGHCGFSAGDITQFELENCLDLPRDLVAKIFTDILHDSLTTAVQPIPGAVERLTAFTRQSTVTIITARTITQPVVDWLHHFFSDDAAKKIRVVATGDHDDKVRHIHDHGLKYFVDDRVETCLELARQNITPIVFHQPWNRDRHQLTAVADWDELAGLVAAYGETR